MIFICSIVVPFKEIVSCRQAQQATRNIPMNDGNNK
jgi:hypothetical protein